MIMGKRYYLTRLGFVLNVVPLIMKSVIGAVLAHEESLNNAVSAYIDDLYVEENTTTAITIREKLVNFSLVWKDLEDSAHVLGLKVSGENGQLRWKRESTIPDAPKLMTRRDAFCL